MSRHTFIVNLPVCSGCGRQRGSKAKCSCHLIPQHEEVANELDLLWHPEQAILAQDDSKEKQLRNNEDDDTLPLPVMAW